MFVCVCMCSTHAPAQRMLHCRERRARVMLMMLMMRMVRMMLLVRMMLMMLRSPRTSSLRFFAHQDQGWRPKVVPYALCRVRTRDIHIHIWCNL
jgi:hypothetical protein